MHRPLRGIVRAAARSASASRRGPWRTAVGACVLLVLAIGGCAAGPAPSPRPSGPDGSGGVAGPTASATSTQPTFAATGPFSVGTKDFTLGDGADRLDGAVAYPTRGSAPDVQDGPFPLVVWSVGLGGTYEDALPALTHLASYGFVVTSWTARGESGGEFWAGAATRPLDTRRVIDHAADVNRPGGELAGAVDTDRIAVVGHSSGGWTALEAGGAQMALGFCDQTDLVARIPYSNCPQFAPNRDRIAAMLGLTTVPTGLWPSTADPRVRAVVALAPDGDIWGAAYEGIGGVSVPTMVVAGSDDDVNPPDLCAYPIYDHLPAASRTLVVLKGAGHDLGGDPDGVVRHLVAAFVMAKVKGDSAAISALEPSHVAFDGVRYLTGTATAPSAVTPSTAP